ncbi:hypothetical protein EST38_g9497 [Candolleomyces aberdarensis]|uniref:Uncharacterized protein n=1 Tax=Candolleomyces aberdarensis TaxID=2316362 RepID=A0A4Q2DBH8_9AGAR|nr:hypothetical protein EST38_g9497 [Candolleomyces aberdarensis]
MIQDEEMPVLPTKWKAIFAKLALVNRTFFHASTDVLWEVMDTVQPFFQRLLDPDMDEDGMLIGGALSYFEDFLPTHWERFELYSSKMKTLILHRKNTLTVRNGWLYLLSIIKGRPQLLFPSVKRLYLTSNDDFSLFIAFQALPEINFLSIDFDKESIEDDAESCVALTRALRTNAPELTALRILNPVTSHLIDRLSKLSPLTFVHLRINDDIQMADECERLNSLRSLEKLVIEQTFDERDVEIANAFPVSCDIARPISRKSKLAHLKDIVVKANGTTQFEVAAGISPHHLTDLELDVLPDILRTQMVLAPLFITIHAKRNPQMTSLKVRCPPLVAGIDPSELGDLRGNTLYTSTTPFIAALASLAALTTLSITEIPFFAVDVIIKMFRVLQKLPLLETFRFLPSAVTILDSDVLALPPLALLEENSRQNPRLVELAIPMDPSAVPDVPRDYLSTHNLRSLWLNIPTQGVVALSQGDQAVELALYLDGLFPQLKSLSDYPEATQGDRNAWRPIERIVSSYQKLRARIIEGARLSAAIQVD